MPCFKPNKDYLWNTTKRLIELNGIKGPFLEIGCGDGEFTELFGGLLHRGTAIDMSPHAVRTTSERINGSSTVEVLHTELQDYSPVEQYALVIAYDVLEHIPDDTSAIKKIANLLKPGGHLLFSSPVKMSEWRWDDDYYGHIRRYEQSEIDGLLNTAEFRIIEQWDVTFPVLWMMRRLYTRFIKPRSGSQSMKERTMDSAFETAAGSGLTTRIIENLPIWPVLMATQSLFKAKNYGCNTLILAARQLEADEPR